MSGGFTPGPLSAEQVKEQALRDGIAELMKLCSEKQNALLNRIHDAAPWKGIANCPTKELGNTYELLRRSVQQNAKATGASQ